MKPTVNETMIRRRQRAAAAATVFFDAHAGEIGAAAGRRLEPYVRPGEKPADFGLCLKLVGRNLEDRFDVLARANEANREALAALVGPRQELAAASKALSAGMVVARHLLRGLFGTERGDEILAVSGNTVKSHQSLMLWRQGEEFVDRLRTAKIEKPRRPMFVRFDPLVLADELEVPLKRLWRAINAFELEGQKAEAALAEKQAALEQFDDHYRAAVHFAAALCRLAGRPDLARQLKTSAIHRG